MEAKWVVVGLLSLLHVSLVSCQAALLQQACGPYQPVQLTSSQGNIYSPGYAENRKYPTNTQCSFYILVPRMRTLSLEIKDMDLEATVNCESDSVEITNPEEGLLYGRYCGSNYTDRLLIDTNVVLVSFKSDIIVSGRGFHIAYQVSTKKTFCQSRELTCKNRNCVTTDKLCNQVDDCGDGTDEENCLKRRTQKVECGTPIILPELSNSWLRIVGGKEAVPGSWPWQADLQIVAMHPNGHSCGGSLINNRWVVTAAHCFLQFSTPESWRIHLGNHHKFQKDSTEQIRYAEKIYFFNPHYQEDEQALMDDDIALIKLNAEIAFTDDVRPVCLPNQGFEIPVGTKCYSTGWGNSRGSGGNDVLKQIPVVITDIKNCKNPNVVTNSRTMVCTTTHEGAGGICHGDSGGPLVCMVNNKWVLIGISSFSTDASIGGGLCGVDDVPTVFQKTSSKTLWIQSVIQLHG